MTYFRSHYVSLDAEEYGTNIEAAVEEIGAGRAN